MQEKTKNNSGFTLVELIIAMAILAFLMTAVSSFMLSGVMSSRKAKADIVVHNTAQDVYDQLSDSIMSAKNVVLYAYIVDGALDDADAAKKTLSFGPGYKDVNETVSGPIYFVRDEEQKAVLEAMPEFVSGTEIKYFTDINGDMKLYVKQLIIDKAIPIDMAYVTAPVAGKYTNNLTGELVEITEQKKEVEYDDEGNLTAESDDVAQSAQGQTIYSVNDTERNIYSFDEEKMYYERKYAYMTALDDYASGTDKKDYVYSKSFNYMKNGTDGTVTGCAVTVDADKGAMGIDLFFSDRNMTYTTLGMINTRNSYVLKAKK